MTSEYDKQWAQVKHQRKPSEDLQDKLDAKHKQKRSKQDAKIDDYTQKVLGIQLEKRKLSLELAQKTFRDRFTMEWVPYWAKIACANGKYYAPQYVTDQEWYEKTLFRGESVLATERFCYSQDPTFPLGLWLDAPFEGTSEPWSYLMQRVQLQKESA